MLTSKKEALLSAGFWDALGHSQHHVQLAFWGWTHDAFWDMQLLLQPPETLPGVAATQAPSGQITVKSHRTVGSPAACSLAAGHGGAA